MSYSPNQRTTIDQEVFKWVSQQREKDKIVTVNAIRQKAFELGQEYDPNFKASLNWYNNWKKRYDYTESPEAEALKHKKRHYTAAFKLHAVQRAAEMESASQAALELDVSRRCLQRWTEELDLITSVVEHSSNAVYRRPGQGRKVVDSNLDNTLLEWVRESWKQGINVTSGMIRDKAREISTAPNFKASLGWYMKWQKRHGIDLKEQTCNPSASDNVSPLKLRLLQEGEVYTYSPTQPSAKRRKVTRKKLSYDDEALLENDEEFDRQLLTWLVERWEAGDIVSDRMVKDKAMEITSNPDFKASKAWLSAWKRKYNISLENQTYGNEGDDEPEEIIEESEVYDNEVLLEEQQQQAQQNQQAQQTDVQQPTQAQQQQGETSGENPLTPTKEEAATALASLSAEDHEAAGLEIAEALQKLANAFGITAQSGDDAKEAMAQLTAAYQADNPEFLLEGAGQVAVEEVVSEEVVTDEPMVVIETAPEVTTTVNNQTNNTPVVSYSVATTTKTVTTPLTSTVASNEEVHSLGTVPAEQIPTTTVTEIISTSTVSQATNNVMVTTSPLASYISEEVVIVAPEMETAGGDDQVQVLVQGDNSGLVLLETTPHEEVIVQQSCGDDDEISVSVAPPISESSDVVASETNIVTEIVTTSSDTPLASDPKELATENVSIETVNAPQELLDIVQESITGGVTLPTAGEETLEVSSDETYNEGFKRKVISRVAESGSIEEAAKEFSVPWEALMSWITTAAEQASSINKQNESAAGGED